MAYRAEFEAVQKDKLGHTGLYIIWVLPDKSTNNWITFLRTHRIIGVNQL